MLKEIVKIKKKILNKNEEIVKLSKEIEKIQNKCPHTAIRKLNRITFCEDCGLVIEDEKE